LSSIGFEIKFISLGCILPLYYTQCGHHPIRGKFMFLKGGSVMYKKILVAIDASDQSIRALSKAVQLANHFRSELTLLHVINYPIQYLEMGLIIRDMPESAEQIAKAANQIFQAAMKGLDFNGISVTKKSVAGSVAHSVLEEGKNGYDLIVMGTVGRSPWGGALIGSATQRVLGRAACPVLVVK
jgi:nucleotide-binding universal stress UspA family protein